MSEIQGYLSALNNRGKRKFVRFGGGFTSDPQHGVVSQDIGDAIDIARCSGQSLYDVPEAVAIDENNEIVEANQLAPREQDAKAHLPSQCHGDLGL